MHVVIRTLSRYFSRLYSIIPVRIHVTIECKLEVKHSPHDDAMGSQDGGTSSVEEGPDRQGHADEDEVVQDAVQGEPEVLFPLLDSLHRTGGHHAA